MLAKLIFSFRGGITLSLSLELCGFVGDGVFFALFLHCKNAVVETDNYPSVRCIFWRGFPCWV
jgi:hypothetical protein